MLQTLSEQIQLCYERAAEAKRRAEETGDPEARADLLKLEKRWHLLARSYQLGDRLKYFIPEIPGRLNAANSVVDVTERPRGEQPLRGWEEDLQAVIGSTPFMLTRCSSDLRYQFVSRAFAQMFGREPRLRRQTDS